MSSGQLVSLMAIKFPDLFKKLSLHSLQFEQCPCALKAQVNFVPEFENSFDSNIAVPVIHKIIASLHGFEAQRHQPSVYF